MRVDSMFEVDALLAQEAWARRLARALVRDRDEADEVVQDARLAWWQHPPRDVNRAQAWLGAVVRNIVRNRRRAQMRRQRLLEEGASAAATSVPGPETLMERLEAQRELVDLVSQLAEPYRQVVLLRYYGRPDRGGDRPPAGGAGGHRSLASQDRAGAPS
jgi:RNA polymerase sigma factor (sigma-70 family)